jgi:FkbM family methyltransferase
LENPRNHVVFEPDKLVISALIKNRNTHKSKFYIVNGIISEKPMKLIHSGYSSNAIKASKNDKDVIHSISLKDIMKKTKLDFDCLVADCEGCLCDFFEENEKYLKNYKMIIFESDLPNKCNYNKIKEKLKLWGFHIIVDKFVSVWENKKLL